MGGTPSVISLEPELKASIINYCAQLESGIAATHVHLLSYVQLEGSTGMLTRLMFPKYVESRDATLDVFDAMNNVVAALREQFAAACDDFETYEDQLQSQLEGMAARIAELEALVSAGAGGSGGGSFGGGGGSFGGGGFTPPPAPTMPDLSADDDESSVEINISIDADGNVDVDVDAEGDNVNVNIDIDTDDDAPDAPAITDDAEDTDATDETSDSTSASSGGSGAGGSTGGPSTEPPPVPLSDETLDGVVPASALYEAQLTPAEQAERAAFYERLWEEQAARDPLGRSAMELRLAWERREPIVIDPHGGGEPSIGYDAPTTGLARIGIPWGLVPAPAGVPA